MTKNAFAVIGRPLPKVDAWAKVVGETKYADDLFLPRMAYAKLLRSAHAHARIRSIDTSRARALPGVLAVVTAADLPRVKFGILPVSQDEEALCAEKVRMVGDPVAAVAAVDEETAEQACRLIEVDYEPLVALMSIFDSLAHPETRIPSTATVRTSTRTSRSSSATSTRPSTPPTWSARTSSSSRAAITCRWSSTPPSPTGPPTAS